MHYSEILSIFNNTYLEIYPVESFFMHKDEFFIPTLNQSRKLLQIEANINKPNFTVKMPILGYVEIDGQKISCEKWCTFNVVKDGAFNSKGLIFKQSENTSVLVKHFNSHVNSDGNLVVLLDDIDMFYDSVDYMNMDHIATTYVNYLNKLSVQKVIQGYYDQFYPKEPFPKVNLYDRYPDLVDKLKEHHVDQYGTYTEKMDYKPSKPPISVSLKGSSKIDSLNACIKRVNEDKGANGGTIFMYDLVHKIKSMGEPEAKEFVSERLNQTIIDANNARAAFSDIMYYSILTGSIPESTETKIKGENDQVHSVSLVINN